MYIVKNTMMNIFFFKHRMFMLYVYTHTWMWRMGYGICMEEEFGSGFVSPTDGLSFEVGK